MTRSDYDMIQSFQGIAFYHCHIKEDAEDVMQDVFLKVLRNEMFDQMQEIEKRKYVVWLIKNKCLDQHRSRNIPKRKGINVNLFYENGAIVYGPKTNPDVYGRMELKEVLQKAKENKICESLMLLVAGYKNREIAKVTGKSINSVLGRCRLARKYLREEF